MRAKLRGRSTATQVRLDVAGEKRGIPGEEGGGAATRGRSRPTGGGDGAGEPGRRLEDRGGTAGEEF